MAILPALGEFNEQHTRSPELTADTGASVPGAEMLLLRGGPPAPPLPLPLPLPPPIPPLPPLPPEVSPGAVRRRLRLNSMTAE
jgi:hypothetical protein